MNTIELYKTNLEVYDSVPSLQKVCKGILPIPSEAVLLGMATDEKPVLFNVQESYNLLVWDRIIGQGICLIKTAVEFIMHYKDQTHFRTEFVILSNNTSEWIKLSESGLGVWDKDACIAVVPFWDRVADQVLFALSEWSQGARGTKEPVILFIDGLENVLKMSDNSKECLKKTLSSGRKKSIFVVGTARSENKESLKEWMQWFKAEMFGQEARHWFYMDENGNSVFFFAPTTVI